MTPCNGCTVHTGADRLRDCVSHPQCPKPLRVLAYEAVRRLARRLRWPSWR